MWKLWWMINAKPWIINLSMTRWNNVPLYDRPSMPWRQMVRKFSTVFGASYPNKPIVIVPIGLLSIVMSKFTSDVTLKCAECTWNFINFFSFLILDFVSKSHVRYLHLLWQWKQKSALHESFQMIINAPTIRRYVGRCQSGKNLVVLMAKLTNWLNGTCVHWIMSFR